MKYFGEKSLSSVLSGILRVLYYFLIVLTVCTVAFGVIFLFALPPERLGISASEHYGWDSLDSVSINDWQSFRMLPLPIRIFMFPYFGAVMTFLLLIIRRTQLLFYNLKNEKIFSKANAVVISKIAKLLIVFSALTFRFFLIIVALLLFLLSKVFRSGSVLQEEHELTV